MERALAHASDRYEIPIQSRSVSRVYVESGFDLKIFDDGSETTIRVEDPLAVVTENSRPPHRADMEDALTPGCGVFGRIVVSGSALRKEKRVLEIVFHPGVWFWVEPSYQPEGWGPYGSKGLILICMPGTEMAVWFGVRRPMGLESDFERNTVASV